MHDSLYHIGENKAYEIKKKINIISEPAIGEALESDVMPDHGRLGEDVDEVGVDDGTVVQGRCNMRSRDSVKEPHKKVILQYMY